MSEVLDNNFDVLIHGAGMVGLTLAGLLAQQQKRVALIDRHEPDVLSEVTEYDLRVSAITQQSQQVFQRLHAWSIMQQLRVSPYERMCVWEDEQSEIRFHAADIGAPDLGHIIENRVISSALYEKVSPMEHVTFLSGCSISGFTVNEKQIEIQLDSGKCLTSTLLVGADGGRSMVRELADITIEKQDYGQAGLVVTIKTENGHELTAWQRFLPEGPIALLPLADKKHGNHYCSIVWTLPGDRVAHYVNCDEKYFTQQLCEATQGRLGKLELVSERRAFPLQGMQAQHYVKPRIALIGDAAHQIHPLAGQGVNLGIKDAIELTNALEHQKDCGDYLALRRYERARRGDNEITMRAMEGFKLLFGHSANTVKTIRQFGLKTVNQMPKLKQQLIKTAMGL